MQKAILSKWCCTKCGGHNVEKLDWVSANGLEFIGGDGCGTFFCQDCADHPPTLEERSVEFKLCDSCEGHEWGSSIPIPGVIVTADGHVERCDECKLYESDLDAAIALSGEARKRNPDQTFRVRHFVDL